MTLAAAATIRWAATLTLTLCACESSLTGPASPPELGAPPVISDGAVGQPRGTDQPGPSAAVLPHLSPDQVKGYMSLLSRAVVSRVLTTTELAEIDASAELAIPKLLEAWKTDPGLAHAARSHLEQKLAVGGSKSEIDFGVPGRTVLHVVKNGLPWSTILTASTCYDEAGAASPCDTGAPFAAGIIGTRAYLAANASRFNLSRARTVLNSFLCRSFPLEDNLEPRLEKERLIPMFQASTPADQTDDRAVNGFGNGLACYSCHGQFGRHAQLFVKFDATGIWHGEANGLQDDTGELGRSVGALMASHLASPAEAGAETSQMLGQPVDNLAAAAAVIAASPLFTECAVQQVLRFGLDLDVATDFDTAAVTAIATRARTGNVDPSFGDLVYQVFSDAWVVQSVIASLQNGGS